MCNLGSDYVCSLNPDMVLFIYTIHAFYVIKKYFNFHTFIYIFHQDLTLYNCKRNVLSAALNKTFPSFLLD